MWGRLRIFIVEGFLNIVYFGGRWMEGCEIEESQSCKRGTKPTNNYHSFQGIWVLIEQSILLVKQINRDYSAPT